MRLWLTSCVILQWSNSFDVENYKKSWLNEHPSTQLHKIEDKLAEKITDSGDAKKNFDTYF